MNDRELATVLAALRYWQRNIFANRVESDIRDLATGGNRFEALRAGQIDDLCRKLNATQPKEQRPRVIVVVEGGLVRSIFADRPLDVDVLDHDNWDGADPEIDSEECQRFQALAKEIDEGNLLEQVY